MFVYITVSFPYCGASICTAVFRGHIYIYIYIYIYICGSKSSSSISITVSFPYCGEENANTFYSKRTHSILYTLPSVSPIVARRTPWVWILLFDAESSILMWLAESERDVVWYGAVCDVMSCHVVRRSSKEE